IYDAAGDISTEKTLPAASAPLAVSSADMAYGAGNRLVSYNSEAVRFDADGNMIHGPLNGGMADFSFDSRNRLTGAGNTQYIYDAENQRIAVNADGQETRYTVNSQPLLSQVLTRTRPDGTQTYYVYGLGLIGEETGGVYRTYHFDFRGSTTALTNETGTVTERFRYSPYGALVNGDASATPFLFNGMYGVMMDASGLYYMRARYYNPEIRRFVNMDIFRGHVFKGQRLNRFGYAIGNPIIFFDPLGLYDASYDINELTPDVLTQDLFEGLRRDFLSEMEALQRLWEGDIMAPLGSYAQFELEVPFDPAGGIAATYGPFLSMYGPRYSNAGKLFQQIIRYHERLHAGQLGWGLVDIWAWLTGEEVSPNELEAYTKTVELLRQMLIKLLPCNHPERDELSKALKDFELMLDHPGIFMPPFGGH
ncbi:MAG: RHS repeat-associated core domain-containing protein, partial [Gammaproteobacteria bacterium]|nr:RHS repeat-associated core domain-containing protein [Gammaproteobacteria bacterium]